MNKKQDINRRDFIKRLYFGALGSAAMVTFPGLFDLPNTKAFTRKEKELKPIRPNIILIVVDDQIISSLDFMPAIRSQLVDKGITLPNSFCASPVCAPSRASIFTGQYLHNHGEATNAARKFVNIRDTKNTLSIVLQDGGYKNILIGKYTHGYNDASYIPPGWDEWYALLGGAPGYYNYQMSENGKSVFYGDGEKDYSTDVLAQKAADFLKRHRNSSQPFFMYLAPFAPHYPQIPSSRHLNKLRHLKFASPLYEQDINDKPGWVHDNHNRKFNTEHPGKVIPQKMSTANIRKLETLLAVDEMIDNIIKKLKKTGKLVNTFIFYLADNGDDLSRHLYARGKLLPYEEGIRTPIIVRGAGIQAASKRNHLTSTVDLLPTIAELARIPIPGFVDGRSLAPILSCNPLLLSAWRKSCLVELGKLNKWPTMSPPPPYKLLRARSFKYIEYDTGEKEFYDLRSDPHELLNVYPNLAPEQKKMLHVRLKQLFSCSKGNCREAENKDISIYF